MRLTLDGMWCWVLIEDWRQARATGEQPNGKDQLIFGQSITHKAHGVHGLSGIMVGRGRFERPTN